MTARVRTINGSLVVTGSITSNDAIRGKQLRETAIDGGYSMLRVPYTPVTHQLATEYPSVTLFPEEDALQSSFMEWELDDDMEVILPLGQSGLTLHLVFIQPSAGGKVVTFTPGEGVLGIVGATVDVTTDAITLVTLTSCHQGYIWLGSSVSSIVPA